MPIYDYVCESCGRVIEVIHGLHADGPAECPDCGGAMSKVFAAPTIHFKGSGWAKKDRRNTSGAVKTKGTTQGEASGAPGSGHTTDPGSSPASASDSGGASGDRGASADPGSSSASDSGGASGDRGSASGGRGGASGGRGSASGGRGGTSGDSGHASRAERADKE